MNLNFEGNEAKLQETTIHTKTGTRIPLELIANKKDGTMELVFSIVVDGKQWAKSDNVTRAFVLFNLMKDHLTEYTDYIKD